MSIADRIRAKRLQHQLPTSVSPSTETDTSPVAPNSQTHRPSVLGSHPITVTNEQIDGATLQERTVKFFTVILENSPITDGVVAALIKRLQPRLIKMLGEATEDDLRVMYQAWIVGLTQVYSPHAEFAHINLQQRHMWTDDVAQVIGKREPEVPALDVPDAETMLAAAAVDESISDEQIIAMADEMVLDENVKPVKFAAASNGIKPPDVTVRAGANVNTEPMVGVEIDGEVVMMTQSEAEELRRAVREQLQS